MCSTMCLWEICQVEKEALGTAMRQACQFYTLAYTDMFLIKLQSE